MIPPLRRDGGKVHKATPNAYLRPVLEQLGLARPGLGWYEATRHTFASQWVLAGGSIHKLKEVLGHYSVVVTERYAHLRPDLFTSRDLAILSVDSSVRTDDAVPIRDGAATRPSSCAGLSPG